MPLSRAQAAQGEISENAEEQDNKGSEFEGTIRSEFEAELLAAVQEQRDLLKEYKERQNEKVLEMVDILLIGKVLTQLREESTVVPVRMVNVTEEKRKVLVGSELAKCETANFVVCSDFENGFQESKYSKEMPKHLTELYEGSTKDLVDENQRRKVFDLLCENADVFSSDSSDLGRTGIVKHRIITGSAKPIKQPPRRLPLAKRDVACQAIDDMLKHGVIEPSTSPWSSPVVLVAKKNGTL